MKSKKSLPDVQNSTDLRGIPIHKVGINNYKIPFKLEDKSNEVQHTIGEVSMYTSLSKENKGVNMSRYSQVIEKALMHNVMSCEFLDEVMKILKERLLSMDSWVKIKFPYFIKKVAPVSKNASHFCIDCKLEGKSYKDGSVKKFLTVEVNYTSLCPCSKEMSLYDTGEEIKPVVGQGAHNQRSLCKLTVQLDTFIWIEDLVDIIEESASCPIWNTLKREDEQYVTERAYQNPRFVEDMAREVYIRMQKLVKEKKTSNWLAVFEHYESIHQSNAVSVIKGGNRELE